MTASKEAPREHWLDRGDARLFAQAQGHGATVLLLHGGMADHRAMAMRAGALAARHHLVTPDVRGAGRSVYRGPLGWDQLADDVVAWLDHLRVDTAVVGGASAGAGIALRVALRHPSRVRALIQVWPACPGRALGWNEPQRRAMERMRDAGQRALVEGVDALLTLFEGLPAPVHAVACAMVRGFDVGSVAATTTFLASGAQPFERLDDLGSVTAPTLVIAGLDPEHPAELAAQYARHIPRATLHPPTADLAPVISAFVDGLMVTP